MTPDERRRGIFANRTLNLRSVDVIGYDMDYTLIHYDVGAWEAAAFESAADILGEQAVLVGGMCALARTGFEALVEAGVSPRMAYIDTVHELKYIADLIHERGIAGMYAAISAAGAFRTDDGGESWKPINSCVAEYVGAPQESAVGT